MPRTGRPKTPIPLSERTRAKLQRMAGSRTEQARLVQRARIILMAADGHLNTEIARAVGLTNWLVGRWRKHEKVHRWLARRPRYHVHFVPTYS